MNYDAPPFQPDVSTDTSNSQTAGKPVLDPLVRSAINAALPKGYRVVVNRPVGDLRPQLIIERLPRSSSGHRPRRPVFIPLESFAAVHAQPVPKPKNMRRKASNTRLKNFAIAVKGFVAKPQQEVAAQLAANCRSFISWFGRLFAAETVEATA